MHRHSLRLSDWGPYTKRYMGISHIPDECAGFRFDLSVFPGLYRRKVEAPNVNWESGYHPWQAAGDLNYFAFRHELEWKDRVFCDISYIRIDDASRLVRCQCVNNTDQPQTLVLHYMASMNFPTANIYSTQALRPCRVRLPEGGLWIAALDYEELHFARPRPHDGLAPDGLFGGECRGQEFTGPSGLGADFGKDRGDRVTYRITVPRALPTAAIVLRYRMESAGETKFTLTGPADHTLILAGDASFQTVSRSLGSLPAGEHRLTLTSDGGAAVRLDGMAIVPDDQIAQVAFEPVIFDPRPQRAAGPHARSLILKYPDVERHYGVAWNYDSFTVREIHDSDLDCHLRHFAHDHVRNYFPGDEKEHYTNVFLRPISLKPHEQLNVDGLVCQGSASQVRDCLQASEQHFRAADVIHDTAAAHAADPAPTPAGEPYRLSQRLMAAATLSNVVYPQYAQRSYIKHYTPGRWWDCLYTWDAGFLGLGLLEHDVERAIDCLKAYVTDPGNPHAAFIHHGSMVPTQMFLFLELWNRTQEPQLLEYFYPRLKQYYLFFAGRSGGSTTATLQSGLLRPWDYFYNSGGWDDYPPQMYVHVRKKTASVAPVISTAMAARSAAILRMAASALALDEDAEMYDADIRRFTDALHLYAWDEPSGYFGYAEHDARGRPTGILRHDTGVNFNMGLDGVSPLWAGICTPSQEQRLLAHLRDGRELWTPIGLSAVDQSAPYYRRDGYWNGTVWMPHQWFAWKTMLDLGQTDFARQIAQTGLDVWQREAGESYHCFEHFIIETGRGAGWHQFTGLSSPVMSWFAAYYRPGRCTCGFDGWIEKQQFTHDNCRAEITLTLHGRETRRPCVILCLNPHHHYDCTWCGSPITTEELIPGCLSITLPEGDVKGSLTAVAQPS